MLSGLSDEAGQSIDQQIEAHIRLGWNELELRSLNGIPFYKLDKKTFLEVRQKLKKAKLSVTAVSSCIGNWERSINTPFDQDTEELKILMERMNELGSKYLRIMSYPNDGLPEIEWRKRVIQRLHYLSEVAENSGIILLHENCSGWGGISPRNTLDLMEEVNHPSLRLLFDIGNGIAYNYDSYEFLQRIHQYVEHIHIKDGILQGEEVMYTLPGQGSSKVVSCLKWIINNGYQGILSIEPHLQFIPHLKKTGEPNNLMNSYINYGRHLEKLLNELVSLEREAEVTSEQTTF